MKSITKFVVAIFLLTNSVMFVRAACDSCGTGCQSTGCKSHDRYVSKVLMGAGLETTRWDRKVIYSSTVCFQVPESGTPTELDTIGWVSYAGGIKDCDNDDACTTTGTQGPNAMQTGNGSRTYNTKCQAPGM